MKRLSMRGCRLLAVVLCPLVCGVGAVQSHAQQNAAGVLSGTVVDPAGGAVQNATVVATSESSASVSKAATDQDGKFSFANLPPGSYKLEVSAPGFALATREGVRTSADGKESLTIALSIGSVSDAILVEANASGSIAAEHAPMDGLLEAHSARTEITTNYIQNFTSPISDFSELTAMAPGTFAVNSNGVGLGQAKTYFRGFADGNYDIDFDGVPFYDTNDPTHHSWAFFPSPWIGNVDFDRSPGTASTIGPTPFGGSIHLFSPDMSAGPLLQANVSYGSFNTKLIDGSFDTGLFDGRKSNLLMDVHSMTSDGYETFNFQDRQAGSLKYIYKFSDNNVFTAYSGVVRFSSNTPNNNPTRGQIQQFGDNYLLNNDPTSPYYYRFGTYKIPTDVEYADWNRQFGRGWQIDFRPYTLSYYNKQFYNNSSTAATGFVAVDKLNSYRKYGDTFVVSQVSKYGIFRAGLWYEWAKTNRFQIPSNVVTRADYLLPNFHERFNTNSAQPFVEYEFRATQQLTLTAGFKFANFDQSLQQYQDNGKTVGCLGGTLVGGKSGQCVGGVPLVNHSASYNSYLPSVDASYHLLNNWSVYGQFSMGTKIPPSSVFDTSGGTVALLPKPTGVKTYQAGTVLKLKQVTLNADVFYIRFQNPYTSVSQNNTTGIDWVSAGDTVSKGFEGEANVYLTRGLSFYVNGTVGTAKYASDGFANKGLWVANSPANTEAFGFTYQQKHFDLGIFDKRIGPMWNDNTPYNQVVPINPFSVTNLYLNYNLRNGSRFDQTKFRISFNNLLDNHNIVGDQQAAGGAAYVVGSNDLLQLLPGRSVTMSIIVGFSPRR